MRPQALWVTTVLITGRKITVMIIGITIVRIVAGYHSRNSSYYDGSNNSYYNSNHDDSK